MCAVVNIVQQVFSHTLILHMIRCSPLPISGNRINDDKPGLNPACQEEKEEIDQPGSHHRGGYVKPYWNGTLEVAKIDS